MKTIIFIYVCHDEKQLICFIRYHFCRVYTTYDTRDDVYLATVILPALFHGTLRIFTIVLVHYRCWWFCTTTDFIVCVRTVVPATLGGEDIYAHDIPALPLLHLQQPPCTWRDGTLCVTGDFALSLSSPQWNVLLLPGSAHAHAGASSLLSLPLFLFLPISVSSDGWVFLFLKHCAFCRFAGVCFACIWRSFHSAYYTLLLPKAFAFLARTLPRVFVVPTFTCCIFVVCLILFADAATRARRAAGMNDKRRCLCTCLARAAEFLHIPPVRWMHSRGMHSGGYVHPIVLTDHRHCTLRYHQEECNLDDRYIGEEELDFLFETAYLENNHCLLTR